jgi:signal transduction histidine kinase
MGRPTPEDYAARIGELRRLEHELRTPLTLIQGYVSLLEDDELASEKRREACALVREKCAEMNRIISTLLDDASEQENLPVMAEAPRLQAAT